MKKYIFLIVGIVFLTGCSIKEIINENKKTDNYESIANEETKNYIKNKYNFTLSNNNIISTSLHVNSVNEWDIGIDYSGYATITATYNNKNFKVYVNYLKKDTSEYYDNYEQSDIINSIKSYYYNKLNISETNSKLYLTDEMVFDKHTNKRFSDVYSFIHSINSAEEQSIIILTTDEVNESEVKSLTSEFENINILIYKLKQDIDINSYSNNVLIEENNYLDTNNPILNSENDLYVEKEYICRKESKYKYTEYIIKSLDEGIYAKIAKKDDIEIQKINYKQIKSYQSILDKCGSNLQVKNAYKLSAKPYHSELLGDVDKSLYIYNTNIKINNQYQKYSIFVNDQTNCNHSFSKSYSSLKNGTAYIIVVE